MTYRRHHRIIAVGVLLMACVVPLAWVIAVGLHGFVYPTPHRLTRADLFWVSVSKSHGEELILLLGSRVSTNELFKQAVSAAAVSKKFTTIAAFRDAQQTTVYGIVRITSLLRSAGLEDVNAVVSVGEADEWFTIECKELDPRLRRDGPIPRP